MNRAITTWTQRGFGVEFQDNGGAVEVTVWMGNKPLRAMGLNAETAVERAWKAWKEGSHD